MATDRQSARRKILSLVREMARQYPGADYSAAREQFGLLGKIKTLTGNVMPTARQCWEAVGLERSHLVDEFEFTQQDCAEQDVSSHPYLAWSSRAGGAEHAARP